MDMTWERGWLERKKRASSRVGRLGGRGWWLWVEVVVRGGKHSQTLAGLLQVGWYRVDSEGRTQKK